MNDKRRPVGLILSAGFSSRMKDFKPLMKIGGRTPLQMLIESFSIAGIKDIFVVVGHNADKIRGYINEHFADKNINLLIKVCLKVFVISKVLNCKSFYFHLTYFSTNFLYFKLA